MLAVKAQKRSRRGQEAELVESGDRFSNIQDYIAEVILNSGMDKHTQKPKQTQVSVSPMKRTNMSLCVFMFQCLNG